MSIIDMNKMIVSRKGLVESKVPQVPAEVIAEFVECININNLILSDFENTNNYNSFFMNYRNILEIVGKEYASECFYAVKLGSDFQGVPNKLAYFIDCALRRNDSLYVNSAYEMIYHIIKPYEDKLFKSEHGEFTVKDVTENILGHSVKLLTDTELKVPAGKFHEVWVPDIKRVAIIPSDIGDSLSDDDLENLTYNPSIGICLRDIPIRTMRGRLGVTRSDFDLREVI